MIECIEKSKCTGCKMCKDSCPVNAITFAVDDYGFWYPMVDREKCIQCKKCINSCPSLNIEKAPVGKSPKVFSLWSKNNDTRLKSTSGGVFYEFAKFIIDNNGIVVGVRYSADWKSALHCIARTEEDLKLILGSKYFQSDTEGIYKTVKDEADKGTFVLFCGTPCQNAAMRSFLGKEYTNVFLMDFICRSINSPFAFKKYIEELEVIFDSRVKYVRLKNKRFGWQSLATQVVFENGTESLNNKNSDWWVKGFIYNDLYTRESCFECQYKTLPRKVADITIGDFWGIKDVSNYDMYAGVSTMFINTEKGSELFDKVKECFYYKDSSIDAVLPGNKALLQNAVKTEKQEQFYRLIKENTFSESVRRCIQDKNPILQNVKSSIRNIQRNTIRVLKFIKHREIDVLKYIHLNFMCKNIVRFGTAQIIPYKNAIFDLNKTSRIELYGNIDVVVGFNKLRGSKAETHIRLNEYATWKCYHGAQIFYDVVIEVKANALFEADFFSANGGSVIIAQRHIKFGEDVMLGRNIIIYDSDFHQICNSKNVPVNKAKDVVIEDHVWLTSNVTVLKGVTIGRDSIITAQAVVNRSTSRNSIIASGESAKAVKTGVNWNRNFIPRGLIDYDEK